MHQAEPEDEHQGNRKNMESGRGEKKKICLGSDSRSREERGGGGLWLPRKPNNMMKKHSQGRDEEVEAEAEEEALGLCDVL